MYYKIPINDITAEVLQAISIDKNIDGSANVFVTGINTINRLLERESFPIANKRLAIKNILHFLNTIDNKVAIQNNTKVTISSAEFKSHFNHMDYKKYANLLSELKIISVVPYEDGKFWVYEKGKACRPNLFRVYNEYIQDEPCLFVMEKTHVRTIKTDKSYPAKMVATITNVTANYRQAILAEIAHCNDNKLSLVALKQRLSRLLSLNGDRFIKSGSKSNRVYHSLSNISRISRMFLNISGHRFNDIDVVNCQPLLVCSLLNSLSLAVDGKYISDCQDGTIYERFIGKSYTFAFGQVILDRPAVKECLYRAIYFDFKVTDPVNQEFKKLYPNTYASLKALDSQKDKIGTIASMLQNIEASIFNGLIPKKSKFFYTLFDSIYFTHMDDSEQLILNISERFMKFGILPKLKMNLN